MSRTISNCLRAAALLLLTALALSLAACSKQYPQFFDIAWDEEVQLHDGRVIVVHVKRTFERLGSRSGQWEGIDRDMEVSFDAGGALGRFTQKFERYEVTLIEEKDNQWFIGLTQTTGTPPVEWVNFDTPFLVLQSDGKIKNEILKNFPDEFKNYNVMPDTPDSASIAKIQWQVIEARRKDGTLESTPQRGW